MRGKYARQREAKAHQAVVENVVVGQQHASITDTPSGAFEFDQRRREPIESSHKTCARCRRAGSAGFTRVGGQYFCSASAACRKRAEKLH